MEGAMNACPQCGQNVRPLWPTCRSCGALLMAPPAPVGVGAGGPPPGPTPEEQFFAPAVLQPVVQLPPTPTTRASSGAASGRSGNDAGKWIVLAGMLVFFVAAIATAWFTIKPGAGSQAQKPEVLTPVVPTAGLPTGLGAVVRMEAESTRHTALQTVEQLGSGDLAQLASLNPAYQWVAGDQPSPDVHTVSVQQNGSTVTIAVTASNHDVCAFGQWTPGSTPQYVTMGHESICTATAAPSAGWSTQAGGAASDLPDNLG
jgi:hypothetical protein